MNDTATFDYIAFNASSGDILAYGKTAALAALRADRLAPKADLQIIRFGARGAEMWKIWIKERAQNSHLGL